MPLFCTAPCGNLPAVKVPSGERQLVDTLTVPGANLQTKDRMNQLQDRLACRNIPGLDGLRAIAVFLVIFYHFGFDIVDGGMGVEMFFVLSGFLITWLLLKENEQTGEVSFSLFYKRRTLRIFPAFYVYWLLDR